MRKLVAVPLTLLALVSLPVAAAHASAIVGLTGTTLTVASTADEENTIVLSGSGADVVVEELNPLVGQLALDGAAAPACAPATATEVRCPAAAVTAVEVRLGPGDDAVDALGFDRPLTAYGEAGRDALTGGDQADRLDGGDGNDDVLGGAGDDTVIGGAGRDILDGGVGRDRLEGDDGEADKLLDCGPGDDDLDDDAADPFGNDCEAVVPRPFTVRLEGGPFQVGGALHAIADATFYGSAPPQHQLTWKRCVPGGACTLEPVTGNVVTRFLDTGDAGHTITAIVTFSTRAGATTVESAPTPVIAGLPAIPSIPLPTVPALPTVTAAAGDARAKRTLTTALAKLPTDPRRAARRGALPLPLTLPYAGTATVTLTVPAATARRHGVKHRGTKPLTLGTATVSGARGARLVARVRLSTQARAVLRRAKRLRVDATLQLTPIDVAAPRALTGRAAITFRRR